MLSPNHQAAHDAVESEDDSDDEEGDDHVIQSITNALASTTDENPRGKHEYVKRTTGIPISAPKKNAKTTTKKKKAETKTEPSEYDVYMGRGGLMNKVRNGSLYRQLILQNYVGYKSATFKRDFAVERVIKPIQKEGGRFFVPSASLDKWVIGDIVEVVAPKVMQALRDCLKDGGQRAYDGHLSHAAAPKKSPAKKPPPSNSAKTASCKTISTARQKANAAAKSSAKKKRAAPSAASSTPRKRQATSQSASRANHPADTIRQRMVEKANAGGNTNSNAMTPPGGTSPPSNNNHSSPGLQHSLLVAGSPAPAAPAPSASPSKEGEGDSEKEVPVNDKAHATATSTTAGEITAGDVIPSRNSSTTGKSQPTALDDEAKPAITSSADTSPPSKETIPSAKQSISNDIQTKTSSDTNPPAADGVETKRTDSAGAAEQPKKAEDKVEPPMTRKCSRISSGSDVSAAATVAPRLTRSNSHVTAALTTRPKRQVSHASVPLMMTRPKRQVSHASITPEQSSVTKSAKTDAPKPPKLKRDKSRDSHQGSVGSESQLKFPWEIRFEELLNYAKANDHSNVQQRDKQYSALGRFVKINRQYLKRNQMGENSPLTPEREALLEGMGFVWDMRNPQSQAYDWDAQFRALKAYQKKNGHCNVPLRADRTNALGRWVAYMRKLKTVNPKQFERLGGLYVNATWKKKLDEIGFDWRKSSTKRHVASPSKRHEASPSTRHKAESDAEESSASDDSVIVDKVSFPVPLQSPAGFAKPSSNHSLAAPVSVVTKTVVKPMVKMHIDIDPLTGEKTNFGNNKTWSQCFGMMRRFKSENGHTQVPYKSFPHNNPETILCKFALAMRAEKVDKKCGMPTNLTDEREKLLNSIGFAWKTAYNCTKEGSAKAPVSKRLQERAQAPKPSDRKKVQATSEIVHKTIIDTEGTRWSTYKPLPVDKLFKLDPHQWGAVPVRPPTPENWGVELAYESDGDDSVTF
ncbi:MAG: hypothetical protein SGILL_006484 [Bacillariaceae sp.]